MEEKEEEHLEEVSEEDPAPEESDEEIYSGAHREDMIESGEIEDWEAAFMDGYEEAM